MTHASPQEPLKNTKYTNFVELNCSPSPTTPSVIGHLDSRKTPFSFYITTRQISHDVVKSLTMLSLDPTKSRTPYWLKFIAFPVTTVRDVSTSEIPASALF